MQSTASDKPGLIATKQELLDQLPFMMDMHSVLDRAWRSPFTTKSDFARQYADFIAIASFEGMITTKLSEETWGKEWLITELGMAFREDLRITIERIADDISGHTKEDEPTNDNTPD